MLGTLSVRIDLKRKAKAMSRARGEGSTITQVVNAFLSQYAEGAFKVGIVPAAVKPYPSDIRKYSERKGDFDRGVNVSNWADVKKRLKSKKK